jgi:hypothetical protein
LIKALNLFYGDNQTCRSAVLAATMYRDVQVSREGRMPGVTDGEDAAPAGFREDLTD